MDAKIFYRRRFALCWVTTTRSPPPAFPLLFHRICVAAVSHVVVWWLCNNNKITVLPRARAPKPLGSAQMSNARGIYTISHLCFIACTVQNEPFESTWRVHDPVRRFVRQRVSNVLYFNNKKTLCICLIPSAHGDHPHSHTPLRPRVNNVTSFLRIFCKYNVFSDLSQAKHVLF